MLASGFAFRGSRCAGTACVSGLLVYSVHLFVGGRWWKGVD